MEKNLFHKSGGYLATHRQRIAQGKKSNNEADKLAKEHRMGAVFARNGFQMKLVEEPTNKSHYDALLNGTPAEMKSLKGHNNVMRQGKKAIRKQWANTVLFEFHEMTPKIHEKLNKLKKAGIQGYYYTIEDKEVKPI